MTCVCVLVAFRQFLDRTCHIMEDVYFLLFCFFLSIYDVVTPFNNNYKELQNKINLAHVRQNLTYSHTKNNSNNGARKSPPTQKACNKDGRHDSKDNSSNAQFRLTARSLLHYTNRLLSHHDIGVCLLVEERAK